MLPISSTLTLAKGLSLFSIKLLYVRVKLTETALDQCKPHILDRNNFFLIYENIIRSLLYLNMSIFPTSELCLKAVENGYECDIK